MRVKVNVINNGGCAMIYAWTTDPNDEPYLYKPYNFNSSTTTTPVRAIKFRHNGETIAFETLDAEFSTVTFDNDCFVIFKSDVPFKVFCEKLFNSEFNSPKNYRMLSHNCAYGVAEALKLAEINVDIPRYHVFNQLGMHPLGKVPFFTLSPLDLYSHVRDFKIQSLRQTDIQTRFEYAKTKLHFWRPSSAKRKNERRVVDIIVDEVTKNQKNHEEHTEAHLEILLQTLDLLIKPPKLEDITSYEERAIYFRRRQMADINATLAFSLNLYIATFLAQVILSFAENPALAMRITPMYLLGTMSFFVSLFSVKDTVSENTTLSSSMLELAAMRKQA